MEGMKQFPDKFFDLAIVDPPYGSGSGEFASETRFGGRFDRYKTVDRTGRTWAKNYGRKIVSWDVAPGEDYFTELFRVSKQQIIWGGNYFALPPNRCFIVWKKTNIPEQFTMAMAEYAWCSMNENAKVVELSSGGIPDRFHPTQKPIALYEWILSRFAKPGDKILDTHVGSASSLIACHNSGFEYVGFELDPEYFKAASERLESVKAQTSIFEFI
jgi:site-specific DNA-methyltransferase (adenine-specific)